MKQTTLGFEKAVRGTPNGPAPPPEDLAFIRAKYYPPEVGGVVSAAAVNSRLEKIMTEHHELLNVSRGSNWFKVLKALLKVPSLRSNWTFIQNDEAIQGSLRQSTLKENPQVLIYDSTDTMKTIRLDRCLHNAVVKMENELYKPKSAANAVKEKKQKEMEMEKQIENETKKEIEKERKKEIINLCSDDGLRRARSTDSLVATTSRLQRSSSGDVSGGTQRSSFADGRHSRPAPSVVASSSKRERPPPNNSSSPISRPFKSANRGGDEDSLGGDSQGMESDASVSDIEMSMPSSGRGSVTFYYHARETGYATPSDMEWMESNQSDGYHSSDSDVPVSSPNSEFDVYRSRVDSMASMTSRSAGSNSPEILYGPPGSEYPTIAWIPFASDSDLDSDPEEQVRVGRRRRSNTSKSVIATASLHPGISIKGLGASLDRSSINTPSVISKTETSSTSNAASDGPASSRGVKSNVDIEAPAVVPTVTKQVSVNKNKSHNRKSKAVAAGEASDAVSRITDGMDPKIKAEMAEEVFVALYSRDSFDSERILPTKQKPFQFVLHMTSTVGGTSQKLYRIGGFGRIAKMHHAMMCQELNPKQRGKSGKMTIDDVLELSQQPNVQVNNKFTNQLIDSQVFDIGAGTGGERSIVSKSSFKAVRLVKLQKQYSPEGLYKLDQYNTSSLNQITEAAYTKYQDVIARFMLTQKEAILSFYCDPENPKWQPQEECLTDKHFQQQLHIKINEKTQEANGKTFAWKGNVSLIKRIVREQIKAAKKKVKDGKVLDLDEKNWLEVNERSLNMAWKTLPIRKEEDIIKEAQALGYSILKLSGIGLTMGEWPKK